MSIELAVQTAIRTRLATSGSVTALVPAEAILDRNQRPAPSPSIVLGESQMLDEGTSITRQHWRVFHTVHVWKREASTAGVQAIAHAIRMEMRSRRLDLGPGLHCADARISSTRFLRDPDGETSHGVVAVEVLVVETLA